jgi:hypothetical protein
VPCIGGRHEPGGDELIEHRVLNGGRRPPRYWASIGAVRARGSLLRRSSRAVGSTRGQVAASGVGCRWSAFVYVRAPWVARVRIGNNSRRSGVSHRRCRPPAQVTSSRSGEPELARGRAHARRGEWSKPTRSSIGSCGSSRRLTTRSASRRSRAPRAHHHDEARLVKPSLLAVNRCTAGTRLATADKGPEPCLDDVARQRSLSPTWALPAGPLPIGSDTTPSANCGASSRMTRFAGGSSMSD